MTITIRKAGEAVAHHGVKAAAATTVLRPPRAVTAEEAPTIQPMRMSNATSMMPWRGWFQTFLKEKVLSEKQFATFRNTFFFMPDAIYDLWQSPKPAEKIPISATDPNITHMYRYPSPGSQKPTVQPEFANGEDPYDTNYFKRDTRRRYEYSELRNRENELLKLGLMDENDPNVQAELANVSAGPKSSPGNKGKFATGPTDFDPTGLRSTMSANWQALESSLDSHMPDHLPTPVWVGK
jgi:hypothetical protein